MERETVEITDRRRLRIYDRLALLGELVIGSKIPFGEFMRATRELIARYAPDVLPEEEPQEPQSDMAEGRRAEVEREYQRIGMTEIRVPKPDISNTQIRRGRAAGRELFFVAPGYEVFMRAVGQGKHWTVVDEAERAKIGWEQKNEGYWIWAEISPNCPRLGVPQATLVTALAADDKQLLSLEEYVVVWWFMHGTGVVLDKNTFSWLRTTYKSAAGFGALRAGEYVGWVLVHGYEPEYLMLSFDWSGGRAAEVVKSLPLAA